MHVHQRTPEDEAERQRRYLQLLVESGEVLGESIDYQQTVQNVCDIAVRTIADICLLDLGTVGDLHLAAASHRDPAQLQKLRGAGRFLSSAERMIVHSVWSVITTGEPLLVPSIDARYIAEHSTGPEHEAFMTSMRYRSMLIVPLRSKVRGTLGTLTLVRTGGDALPYDELDLRFAMDLGRRFATAISKSQLYAQTLKIATQFQGAALPRALPHAAGMTFDAYYEPSSEDLLVGGDWYDAFELPDGRIALTVGDVLGHGIDAAVWMSRLRNSLRGALFADPDPARALTITDRLMRIDAQDEFSTALVAIVDSSCSTMTYASAGHPGPMIWEPGRGVSEAFGSRSLPLGIGELNDEAVQIERIQLQSRSFAAFFTDGLLEWSRDIADAWERIAVAIERADVREALHPARMLRHTVIGGHKHQDDIAILTLRMDTAPG